MKERKRRACFVLIAVMVSVMLFGSMETQAAGKIVLGLLGSYQGEEYVGGSSAFAIASDEIAVVISDLINVGNKTVFKYNNTLVQLDTYEEDSSWGVSLWTLDSGIANSLKNEGIVMEAVWPVQNMQLIIQYMTEDSNGDLLIREQSTTVLDLSGSYNLVLSDYIEEAAYYPAVILDANGACCGFISDVDKAVSPWINEEAFYGGSKPSQSTPDTPSTPDTQSIPNTPDTPDTPGKTKFWETDLFKDVMTGALIGGCAGIVGMIISKKKKGSQGSNMNNSSSYTEPISGPSAGGMTEPIGGNSGIPHTEAFIDDVGPTTGFEDSSVTIPPNGPVYSNPKPAWLAAKGGYMGGRVYPISGNTITIGRGNSNTISYPMETPAVSRNHVKLYWQGNQLMLIDQGSSHGTYLQSVGLIPKMKPVEVNVGDVLYIGEKKNAFEIKA